jgi:hypothetical protein
MPDVMKRQREARRKIIRQWMRLSRDKRQSIDEISAFAKIALQQNENAFVHSRRNPYEKIMGGYCLVRIVGPDRPSLHKHREPGR